MLLASRHSRIALASVGACAYFAYSRPKVYLSNEARTEVPEAKFNEETNGATKLTGRLAIRRLRESFLEMDMVAPSSAKRAPIPIEPYLDAATASSTMYGFIFGQNSFVANVLTSTTIRHLGLIKKLYESPSTEESAKSSLQNLLGWEAATRGHEAVRHDRHSGCHAGLWLYRGMNFMRLFMEKIVEENASPEKCALEAYEASLGPYHSFIVAKVARTAIRYSPKDKATLYKNLGYDLPVIPPSSPQEAGPEAHAPGRLSRMFGGGKKHHQPAQKYDCTQADSEIGACAKSMDVTLNRLRVFLEDEGLYFKDKSSTLFRAKKS